jgi:uncharacterized protein (TIGR02646 family)
VIRLTRPPEPSTFTRVNGKARRKQAELAQAFAANPALQNGQVKPVFDSSIWTSAKSSLIAAQNGKCAFCESKFGHVAYGDVEHFRPKGGFHSKSNESLIQPGYWWLAYAWSNYWASCQICNQKFKKNLFPLGPTGVRATGPTDDLALEEALLIDPMQDDPETHIQFREEVAVSRFPSSKGTVTIDTLGLNRPDLSEARLARWRLIRGLLNARLLLRAKGSPTDELDDLLRSAIRPEEEFSAMSRDLLARLAPELLPP